MRLQIQKWGNSLAFRIPKAFAQEIKISQGSEVDVGIKESCIVLKPMSKKKILLKDLLTRVNKSNIHSEADFGEKQGLEIW